MYELHPVYGAFLQLYRLTAMLREIVEEANKIIHSVVYKQKGERGKRCGFEIQRCEFYGEGNGNPLQHSCLKQPHIVCVHTCVLRANIY